MGPAIRKAKPSDAKQLAELAERTFRDTFSESNTADDMDRHCHASFGEAIQGQEISNPDRVSLLCEQAGKLVGFAQLRWNDAPGCVVARTPGEIQRLYVASDWHGKGIAHALMSACIDEMAGHRSDVVWLGVWERNPRAIAFYKKFGFAEVGEHMFSVGSDPQRDIVMMRPVAGSKAD